MKFYYRNILERVLIIGIQWKCFSQNTLEGDLNIRICLGRELCDRNEFDDNKMT